MQTPSVTPARADACMGTPPAPPASDISLPTASYDYTEHQVCEVHGFRVADSTHGRLNNSEPEHELIWVGIYGEGLWMRPEEVLEVAAAMKHVANAHIERVAKGHLAQLTAKGGAA